jgi:hypothetical protein
MEMSGKKWKPVKKIEPNKWRVVCSIPKQKTTKASKETKAK